jgi:hypothetical protein
MQEHETTTPPARVADLPLISNRTLLWTLGFAQVVLYPIAIAGLAWFLLLGA